MEQPPSLVDRPDRRHLYTIVGIALLMIAVAALTGPRVFTAAPWGDELRTWRDGIEKPLRRLLTWTHNPDHAPLGHLLARAGRNLFGEQHDWSIRIGAWCCALLSVPALAWAGRVLATDGRTRWLVGLLVALMFVVDPTQTFQATQARMYAPLLLFDVCAIGLIGSLLVRPRRPWLRVVGLGLAIGAGLWTHSQMFAVVVAAILMVVGLTIRRSLRYRRFNASALPALAGVIIGLAIAAQGVAKLLGPHNVIDPGDDVVAAPLSQLEDAYKRLSGEGWATAVVLAATIGGLISLSRRRPAVAAFLGLLIIIATVDLLIAANFRAVGQARYLTIAQPAMWIAIASLVVGLWTFVPNRLVRIATFIGFVGLCGFELTRSIDAMQPHPVAGPFRDALRYVEAHRTADARLLILPQQPFVVYARYYDAHVDQSLRDDVAALLPSTRPAKGRAAAAATTQANAPRDVGDVWILSVIGKAHKPKSRTDDPLVVVETLGGVSRAHFEAQTRIKPGMYDRVVLFHIDASGTHAINVD